MASADFSRRFPPSPFQAQGEISPGKNALLHCTTAGSTPPRLDHESFVVSGPLALLGNAFYPVLVHRLAASIHASSPQSVTLMQLRFTSLVVINLRRDLHPQECAHAGRTKKNGCPKAAAHSLHLIQKGKSCSIYQPPHNGVQCNTSVSTLNESEIQPKSSIMEFDIHVSTSSPFFAK
jgi:hypothetical protein